MISFSFRVDNRYSTTFKNLWCRAYNTPFKQKFIELQLTRESTLIYFEFDWTIWQDHAGLDLGAGLLGYCFSFKFYDSRHWDTITNSWFT